MKAQAPRSCGQGVLSGLHWGHGRGGHLGKDTGEGWHLAPAGWPRVSTPRKGCGVLVLKRRTQQRQPPPASGCVAEEVSEGGSFTAPNIPRVHLTSHVLHQPAIPMLKP